MKHLRFRFVVKLRVLSSTNMCLTRWRTPSCIQWWTKQPPSLQSVLLSKWMPRLSLCSLLVEGMLYVDYEAVCKNDSTVNNILAFIMIVRTPGKPGIHLEFENFTWKTLKTWNSLGKSWKNAWNLGLGFSKWIFIFLKFWWD